MTESLKVDNTSPDMKTELLARLKEAVPEVFTDGKLDLDRLQELAGDAVAIGPERYGLTWPGKRDAISMLQAPSRATLVPDLAESVNFDDAQHIFIEGENLEALKLLYKSYFGRVKLIYIDPPYNTGNDFIYDDDFTDPLATYLKQTGQMTEDGDLATSAPEKAGRLHSRWLSMMYPRLSMARQMLKDEGIILISINDAEAANLKQLCDEVFGPENFIAQMVWEKGRKNDAKLLSVGHEYILIYARLLSSLKEAKTVWREEKPGAREIWDEYVQLRAKFGDDDKTIEAHLQFWYAALPKGHPSKKWSRYKRVDKHGPWRDVTISWPGGDGPTYDVIHNVTGQPCKVPEGGWRFSDPKTMEEKIRLGIVEFREDHTEPPFRKSHLRPPSEEFEEEGDIEDSEDETEEMELATMVRGSYFYKQSLVSVKHLQDLMGAKVFDNPKDHEELARLFKYTVAGEPKPIIMDFFAGSGSTAEAVIRLVDSGIADAKFIVVQYPEPTNPKERTGKAALAKGWNTISQVTRERLRRVLKLPDLQAVPQGFRAFHLTESGIERWNGANSIEPEEYLKQLEAFADTLKPGWSAEDVIWEVVLREGFALTSKVVPVEGERPGMLWHVTDDEQDKKFTICLADAIDLTDLKALGLTKDDLFICRDTALTDTVAANLALQCHLKVL
ncbi:site-specific DNA-methyltransferase [Brucella pseudogrignonensis]|uniref:site-specific DNA-methyltransferase (adenine-specific) n=1 Tax=Brucella pseudogrignonensis TaxID=419475 RepID=A0ABU1M487_9HYPH|nr:site-specific DNA-methyltransferase [Brucella pseudogrignonensis]MDR6430536.1 adenine-specific DNA-methyltransferase [Brucella pseudogrignonensis]